MKQLFQDLKTGVISMPDVPVPQVGAREVLIQTHYSVVSSGTERMLVEFGSAGWLNKIRQQPDKVKQVLEKLRTDGILPTIQAVANKLDQPIALGYSNMGVVREVGEGVSDFKPGDRVISNGSHAEFVLVPENLCARVPDEVDDKTAAFTVISSIALHGVRLAAPTIGESVAVLGLGIVGLLTCQILRANGCRVIAFDLDPHKAELGKNFGCESYCIEEGIDPISLALNFSHGIGIDAVLITASTASSLPVKQAAQMCRKRGRVILVGVTGLELDRSDFYQKEITFQVSCSYGPGRYDPLYEEKSYDYPPGYVRWTEKRNFKAALQLMAEGAINCEPLANDVLPFHNAQSEYREKLLDRSSLSFVLDYGNNQKPLHKVLSISKQRKALSKEKPQAALIGSGSFAAGVLLPALHKLSADVLYLVGQKGASSAHLAKKFSIPTVCTDYRQVLDDDRVNTVFISTRHDLHAQMCIDALEAEKHVFLEKPLCLHEHEVHKIEEVLKRRQHLHFMLGFNRRFSPLTKKMKELLEPRNFPLAMTMLVNAGSIPADHWVQDPETGGGRIIGEACHFIDLLSFLCASPITTVSAIAIGASSNGITNDKASIQLSFADGSIGSVHYFANGSKKFPKERLEVFSEGRILQLDNFKALKGYGFPRFRALRLRKQDKGHEAEIAAFLEAVACGKNPPVTWEEIKKTTLASFSASKSLVSQQIINL